MKKFWDESVDDLAFIAAYGFLGAVSLSVGIVSLIHLCK